MVENSIETNTDDKEGEKNLLLENSQLKTSENGESVQNEGENKLLKDLEPKLKEPFEDLKRIKSEYAF